MEMCLSVENLRKSYSSGFTLEQVSFTVEKGTIMGFIGKNGAGKTTTIKCLANLLRRDAGKVSVLGYDPQKNDLERKSMLKQIGVVLDECCFHETLSRNPIAKIMQNIYSDWDNDLFLHYFDFLDLPEKKLVREYSRGMKMKLSLACALAHKPKLLILDEPTSGLDPVVRRKLLDLLREFIFDGEHSVLFSSHITSDLEQAADSITFLSHGKVVLSEEKDLILERHGLLKCGASDMERVDRSLLKGIRRSEFGMEALVTNRTAFRRKYPNLLVDPATLEDVMVYYEKVEENRAGENDKDQEENK